MTNKVVARQKKPTDVEKGEVILWTHFFVDPKAGFLGSGTGQNGLADSTFVVCIGYELLWSVFEDVHTVGGPT